MRIIGGQYKGMKFEPPQLIPTRPTTDFAKEGLFNVINNYFNFDNVCWLDLFGGTGSLSYEFYSRGCRDITLVEAFPKCAEFIRQTFKQLGAGPEVQVIQGDVFQFIRESHRKYDLIFAGPPYALESLPSLPDLIFEKGLVLDQGWFILEHNPNHDFSKHPHFLFLRRYGSTLFSIFVNQPEGYPV